jgi:hypothetical protein
MPVSRLGSFDPVIGPVGTPVNGVTFRRLRRPVAVVKRLLDSTPDLPAASAK